MTYICVDYAGSMAGCGLERAGVAWQQPVALWCFNLLCTQTAQHELGVRGVSSDQFRTLKHKLILVFSSNSLRQEACWHHQPAAPGSEILLWLSHCFCFSSDQREQTTSKTQMHPIVLNIYGFFFVSYPPNQPPVCPGCSSERRRPGEADWSQSAGGKTNISSETNRGVGFIFPAHQLMKWPNLRRAEWQLIGRSTFGSNLSVDLLLLDGVRGRQCNQI